MKRKLFIGSSKEGLDVATQLKKKIDKNYSDWIETVIWSEGKVFSLNKSALESLVKASRRFDYGILVATSDDISVIRKIEHVVSRDNVMLELGLFLGSLGLSRAFVLLEEGCKLPTDYTGITVPIFNRKDKKSIGKAINQILGELMNTKDSFNLKMIPSTAFALGYFENFVQPIAKKALSENSEFNLDVLLPNKLDDIDIEIQCYKRKKPSEEISVFESGTRPRVNRLLGVDKHYWDVPTTLKTLNNLIDKVVHTSEIGVNKEKSDWVGYELRNFKGTLEVLIDQCKACQGNVTVNWLDY